MVRTMATKRLMGWAALLVLAAPVWAFAQPLVAPVPWVASAPQIPHDIISGRATRIKVAEIPAAFGGAYTVLSYSVDFGDGTNQGFVNIAAGAARAIEVSKTYAGAAGSTFNARVRLCTAAGGGGNCADATYRMTIRDNTLTARVNIAIDEGLWYLYKYSASGVGGNGRMLPPGSYGDLASGHAASLNAFFAHGHLESYQPKHQSLCGCGHHRHDLPHRQPGADGGHRGQAPATPTSTPTAWRPPSAAAATRSTRMACSWMPS
jgi:hypothetical protein